MTGEQQTGAFRRYRYRRAFHRPGQGKGVVGKPSATAPRSLYNLLQGRHYGLVVVATLLVHGGLLAWGATRHSPAYDGAAHLVAGISHWKFGRFEMYRVNPPLIRLLASVPVILAEPKLDWRRYQIKRDTPGDRCEFRVAADFLVANRLRSFRYFTLARWTCIPISLLGGYLCSRWARELYGPLAGILALVLWCFSPNIIAHAQMITPDVGATALGVAACYVFWRWLKRPGWPQAFAAGGVLGLAELTKTTWIVLFALWPLFWLAWRLPQWHDRSRGVWLRECCHLSLMVLVALYLINLCYGFDGSFQRLGDYKFISQTLGGPYDESVDVTLQEGQNRFVGSWLGAVPVPLPKEYLIGMDVQKRDFERRIWSYLGGKWREGGWWYYYLYGLAIKVPLGTWILILLALVAGLVLPGYSATWRDELLLLAPPVVLLTLVSSQTGFNHHLRYVLPIFPFAFIWASKLARSVERKHWHLASLAAAALLWSVTSSLWVYPHSLSYFNELVGGPTGGHAHMGGSGYDSNIDWGQDLLYLKRWLDEHPEARPIGIAFCGICKPFVAGIEHTTPPVGPNYTPENGQPPDEIGPIPGWYAMSVNWIRCRDQRYAYFLRFSPVAMAGYSIYIYHITLDEANRVRRELGLPELSNSHQPHGAADG